MSASITAMYFWPGIEADVKKMVEACEPCQLHNRAQSREPHRLALEHVSKPMKAIGFFYMHLLLMDHFSGLPMYAKMGCIKDRAHTI